MGKVQIHTPSLGLIMCQGHLSKDDGPDSGMLWRGHRNCRWCHHSWKRWWRPWQEPAQLHVYSLLTWTCHCHCHCHCHCQTCHCPSWCIKEGTWSCTPARRMPSCLCFERSYPYRATICQHRTWDVSLYLQSWTISHLCLWPCLHHREWPQTPGADQPEEPHWYPSSTSMDAAQTTELWCHHQVLSWEGDACHRCTVKILTPGWFRGGTWHSNSPCPYHPREETGVPKDNPRWPTPVYPCWHNSGRMAWGYQGCT